MPAKAKALLATALLTLPALAQQPVLHRNLYPPTANASEDIQTAIHQATREHKSILLEFGGNWCSDCLILDLMEQQPENAALLASSYVVVHIDIGHMDHNTDIAARYRTPIAHGVPALAILDPHGRLLYAEKEKEFEHPTPDSLHALLDRWKP